MSPVSIVRLRYVWDTDVTRRWVFVASVTAYAMYRSKIYEWIRDSVTFFDLVRENLSERMEIT